MNYANIETKKEGNLVLVIINRPEVLNALNTSTLNELEDVLESLQVDSAIRLLIIAGSGDKAFSAGADLKENERLTKEELTERCRFGQSVFNKIEYYQKPVVAAINGYALGGGCELAMACDLRIATRKSRFGFPEISLGGIPGWGGTQRLPRLVGLPKAMELILTGRMIDAQEAKEIGLVHKVVAEDYQLMEETRKLALQIAEKAPLALRYAKWALNKSSDVNLEIGLDYEVLYSSLLFGTRDNKEGVRAFHEKRRPRFEGQ